MPDLPARTADDFSNRTRWDGSAPLGLLLALGGICAAFLLRNGQLSDLLQWEPALLVLCGTAGAVLIAFPFDTVREAFRSLRNVLSQHSADPGSALELLSQMARKAKRSGLVSLEEDLAGIQSPLLSRALRLATDGLPAKDVIETMRLETRLSAKRMARSARVFEAAGGYAPTLGILGAVLGLVGVMKHLDQIASVGQGVAGAFGSTLYGLALANILLLPVAGKLRASAARWVEYQEMLIDGFALVVDGAHPIVVQERLEPYKGLSDSALNEARRSRTPVPITLAKGA